mgnify:FL=1
MLSSEMRIETIRKSIKKIVNGEIKDVDYSKIDKELLESFLKGFDDIKHGRVHRVV